MRRPAVLVTDAEQRSALAIVRSLGRAGYRVSVASAVARPLAGASRYAQAVHQVPDPLHSPALYVEALADLVRRQGIDVLLPVTEPSLLAVLAAAGRFGEAVVPFASLEQFTGICDKEHVLAEARAIGLHAPEQHVVPRLDAWLPAIADALVYPVVGKPARSVGEHAGRRAKLGVFHAADAAQLRATVGALGPEAFPLLLQRRVVGPGHGIFLLLWEGELVASFAHQRLREKPPSGGVSVYAESVTPDATLLAASRTLLERFAWRGVAMVEFKRDARTGTPYLMEINGRFWGSLQLAIDAGVDFPALLVARALGVPSVPATPWRAGVRTRWWWGDVDHLLARLRRSAAELALPPGAPGRLRAVGDFLRVRRGDHNEVLRLHDPAPFVRESVQWFTRR